MDAGNAGELRPSGGRREGGAAGVSGRANKRERERLIRTGQIQ